MRFLKKLLGIPPAADPEVCRLSAHAGARPVVRLKVNYDVVEMSFEQARNLWGELGREIKKERAEQKRLGILSADEED